MIIIAEVEQRKPLLWALVSKKQQPPVLFGAATQHPQLPPVVHLPRVAGAPRRVVGELVAGVQASPRNGTAVVR